MIRVFISSLFLISFAPIMAQNKAVSRALKNNNMSRLDRIMKRAAVQYKWPNQSSVNPMHSEILTKS